MVAILLGGPLLILFYILGTKRNFLYHERLGHNALLEIGDTQEKRWKLIKEYVDQRKDQSWDEIKTIITHRVPLVVYTNPIHVQEEEKQLENIFHKIMNIHEDKELLEAYSSSKDEMIKAKDIYNSSVKQWNIFIHQMPSGIVASLFGYQEKEILKF
ncbi:MAG: LemA family protein [Tissierellia bacterium]|nr:LemA family protein [Tissierellia bacterium]